MLNSSSLPPYSYQPPAYTGPTPDEVLAQRRRYLSPGLFLYYKKPLMVVAGSMQYVFDEAGRRYLDAFGGIVTTSVGHAHPDVVAAAETQMKTISHTTTIYLNPVIANYAETLAAKMPGDLKVCYFVNSGSEANDLAMLMARLYTGNFEVVALRNAYHGGVGSTMGLTAHGTWKFNTPHSFGIHHAVHPDLYRGRWKADEPNAGALYAGEIGEVIRYSTPGRIAGFFAESIQGVGGVVVFPDNYLKEAYATVRAAGGLCIADEVQSGFGRTGTHYWGFETQGVIPDIVTMAKSIGNGFPLAAVVTTPEIAATLSQKIHFNTYGGNPVACAVGQAVMEVIDRENLSANCRAQGDRLLSGLHRLAEKHPGIGDIRGMGLMVALEFVRDRQTREEDPVLCAAVLEGARDRGVLLGKGGLRGNIIRITPPMCVTAADIDCILEAIDQALQEISSPETVATSA
jgi:alanine-glyoxylate transaminase / (R)-3-amino-2-methylpropionate-pyruvate transaminase